MCAVCGFGFQLLDRVPAAQSRQRGVHQDHRGLELVGELQAAHGIGGAGSRSPLNSRYSAYISRASSKSSISSTSGGEFICAVRDAEYNSRFLAVLIRFRAIAPSPAQLLVSNGAPNCRSHARHGWFVGSAAIVRCRGGHHAVRDGPGADLPLRLRQAVARRRRSAPRTRSTSPTGTRSRTSSTGSRSTGCSGWSGGAGRSACGWCWRW